MPTLKTKYTILKVKKNYTLFQGNRKFIRAYKRRKFFVITSKYFIAFPR